MTPGSLPSAAELQEWLSPFYQEVPSLLAEKLLVYLELLLHWNARMNLSAIRGPREMITRHFGESLFASILVPPEARTLLDAGSGAGFPGLPIALARREIRVTLAESQGKKAAFLREAARKLECDVEVWPRRVESLPPARLFDVVTLRAVDRSAAALQVARRRVRGGGVLLHLTTGDPGADGVLVPDSSRRVVRLETA